MPLKVCPKCKKGCGPRTKKCPDCGHDFKSKKKTKTNLDTDIIGMGTWVTDAIKGMPPIEIPEPLPKGKLTVEQIDEYIMYEGLGYCIFTYIDSKKIDDKNLAKLWVTAREAMQSIQEYLHDTN